MSKTAAGATLTPASAADARLIQDALRPQLRLVDAFEKLGIIAGVDVG